jgi:hypothetical protein
VDDDLLAQRRWNDVGEASERFENVVCNTLPKRSEEEVFPDQRDTTANDNALRTQQSDDVTDSQCQRIYGPE